MSSVRLNLQNPGSPSGYLLERLLEIAPSADRGGAIFAWATAAGVRLLLEDTTFKDFLDSAPFDLVVGLDAITDEAALDAIAEVQQRTPNLTARAFVHDLRPLLFHPKFSWFRDENSITLVSGSGNLTVGGLRSNWEMFTTSVAVGDEADSIERALNDWLEEWADYLFPIDDQRVRDRAAQNSGREELPAQPRQRPRPPQPPRHGVRTFTGAEPVLIAEIPAAGDRWRQANFDRENYEGYFGARVGTQRRILLQHVNADATLGELESRPSVEVASHNWRFELAAATGLDYPTGSRRPIAVFVKMPDGTFLYRLLMPGSASYDTVFDYLRQHANVPEGRMRRIRLTAQELRAVWPDSPIWQAPLNAPLP